MPEAYYEMGKIHLIYDDPESAIECFITSIKIHGINPEILFERGIANFKLGNVDGCVNDWNEATKLGFDLSSIL
jgi:hypothetical protein